LRIIDAALALAVRRGWRRVTLEEVAAESGLDVGVVWGCVTTTAEILSAFFADIDKQVLAEGTLDRHEGSARDRMFDLLMRQFDHLRPHRDALRAVFADLLWCPLSAAAAAFSLRRSMSRLARAADLPVTGVDGCALRVGAAALHFSVLPVWFEDRTEDQAPTMAALDRRLRQAETMIESTPLGRFLGGAAPATGIGNV